MGKFQGDFSGLEILVSDLGYKGSWEDDNGKKIFRSEDKAILNWWLSTGTLQVQGPTAPKNRLEAAVTNAMAGDTSNSVPSTSAAPATISDKPSVHADLVDIPDGVSKRIFVVYGHDEAAREQLELLLHRLDLDPFVLGNTSGGGLTIIEALEKEILPPNQGERFGIVLLTPDDMGYKKEDGSENAEPRARQNVVMEMGMLIAAFGRSRVAILKKGHVEVPSDAKGIIYLGFNTHVRETAPRLCQRLGEAGFELSPNAIARAST